MFYSCKTLEWFDMTTVTLRQSGGSVILAIPKAILDAMGLKAESKVRLDVSGRTLTVTPGFAIDDLVSRMTPDNAHVLDESGERGRERIE
jgi:antitoxin component of MazEF toxin-antitoxin module